MYAELIQPMSDLGFTAISVMQGNVYKKMVNNLLYTIRFDRITNFLVDITMWEYVNEGITDVLYKTQLKNVAVNDAPQHANELVNTRVDQLRLTPLQEYTFGAERGDGKLRIVAYRVSDWDHGLIFRFFSVSPITETETQLFEFDANYRDMPQLAGLVSMVSATHINDFVNSLNVARDAPILIDAMLDQISEFPDAHEVRFELYKDSFETTRHGQTEGTYDAERWNKAAEYIRQECKTLFPNASVQIGLEWEDWTQFSPKIEWDSDVLPEQESDAYERLGYIIQKAVEVANS